MRSREIILDDPLKMENSKKTSHGRWQNIGCLSLKFDINQQSSAGKAIQNAHSLLNGHLPYCSGLMRGKGLDGKLGDQSRFTLAQKDFEDLIKRG